MRVDDWLEFDGELYEAYEGLIVTSDGKRARGWGGDSGVPYGSVVDIKESSGAVKVGVVKSGKIRWSSLRLTEIRYLKQHHIDIVVNSTDLEVKDDWFTWQANLNRKGAQ